LRESKRQLGKGCVANATNQGESHANGACKKERQSKPRRSRTLAFWRFARRGAPVLPLRHLSIRTPDLFRVNTQIR
jgi:hypothetical protein